MKIKGVFLAAILTAVLCFSGNLWAYSGDGDGSTENPYQIANVADFQQLTLDDPNWNKSFILTADVNLAGETLTPVGNSSTKFTGVFDGNDNIISNAVINQPGSNYVGLFGYVDEGGQILNLGVEDVNITGDNYVGGLVGLNFGSLTDCYATGSVSGDELVGGLVGWNEGTLTSCYATGSVTGDWYVGGLVGENGLGSMITACYATGSVSGTDAVGGLVGQNEGGTITACFWDTQTCLPATVGVGYGTSTGVTGKTTAEMKTLSTFTSAGWDFVEIWGIEDYQTYPFLRLTYPVGDLDLDKDVDFFDFAIFADNWLEGI